MLSGIKEMEHWLKIGIRSIFWRATMLKYDFNEVALQLC